MPAVPRSRHRGRDHRASLCPPSHLGTRHQQPGTGSHHTSTRPYLPSYDSTPILIDRVRRKRQRLRSNDSIGSDSAAPPHRSCTHLRAESLPIESYRYLG